MENNKDTVEYFRLNIYNARSSYEAWKMLFYARSNSVVGEEMSKKYVEIQNYHSDFFVITERAFLTTFIILIAHVFEKREDSLSLRKVDEKKFEEFYKKNEEVIEDVMKVRHKIFAHKDKNSEGLLIPSVEKLDGFFNNTQDFYNEISHKEDKLTTWFDYNHLKHTIESMYKNLYRGEKMRLKEIDVEYLWDHNENIISKKV